MGMRTLALLAIAACSLGSAAGVRPDRPNVVFFLIDDMGWTDLGCMGSPLYETPNIDRLAREGLKFTQACSACTVCSPTRAGLMTGKYPARLHLTDYIPGEKHPKAKLRIPDWTKHLPLEEVTIAEVLKGAGYATASIGKWHLGPPEFFPEHQGFDLNRGGCDKGQPPSYFSPYKIPTLEDGPKGEYLTDRLTDEAVKFVEANKDRPFFLYFPHYGVHTPLQAKPGAIEKYKAKIKPGMDQKNATYAAMVESVDESIGRVLAKLDELKLADKTLVVFTSDNGGLLQSTSNKPLRAGKGSAYEGGVRVPLLVRWPGIVAAGRVCDTPAITPDWYPTIAEAAGVKLDPKQTVDGASLLPLLKGVEGFAREAIFWHYPHYHGGGAKPYGAVRKGDLRLVEFFEDDRVELYDLKNDVGETKDLAAERPEKAQELRRLLADWRASVGAQMPAPNPDYDPKGK
jgi:arylsulfatase A